ncbi:MAG: DUF624 domain-containing protein [Angelakisella sp.]
MSIFNFGANYNRPGPGIPKNAPKKTGVKLFFDIIGREFWALLALNLTYLLACVPLITIGPATTALSRITTMMVRDKNVYAWKDFWATFKREFKQSVLFGIPATLFVAAAVWINFGVLLSAAAKQIDLLQMVFIFLWTFLGTSVGCFLFPLIANVTLPAFPLLKNSLLLVVLGKWRTLAAVAVNIIVVALAMLYFPLSIIPMLFLGYFSFLSYFTSFMVWPVIEKYVVRSDEEIAAQAAEAEEQKQPALEALTEQAKAEEAQEADAAETAEKNP